MQNNIVIVGGGGHAKMCIDIIKQINIYNIIGIVDRNLPKNSEIMGIKIIGSDNDLISIFKSNACIAINAVGGGTNATIRQNIFDNLKEIGFILPPIIHKSAIIEPSAILKEGSQIMAGAIIGSEAVIGENCIINSGAIVSHNCIINKNSHITPGAILAGNVKIGQNSIVGMGATIFYDIQIGKNVIINNGKNIFQDIPDNINIKENL